MFGGVGLFIIIAASGVSGIILGLAIYRLVKARTASRWPEASGRVVRSDVEVRETIRRGKEKEKEVGNYPLVVYEYTVNGRRYEGRRIRLTDEPANERVEETLERYPAGAAIAVYYDPNSPGVAVLARGLPRDFGRALTWALAVIPALAAGAVYGRGWLIQFMTERGHEEYAVELMMVSGLLGLVIVGAGAGAQWKAIRERRWPTTTGRVLSSEVERFNSAVSGAGHGRGTSYAMVLYRPAVLYEYDVGGRRYRSNRIASQPEVRVGVPEPAANTVKRYPAGSTPEVRYNPKSQAESILEARVPALIRILILGGGLLALAAYLYSKGS